MELLHVEILCYCLHNGMNALTDIGMMRVLSSLADDDQRLAGEHFRRLRCSLTTPMNSSTLTVHVCGSLLLSLAVCNVLIVK